MSTKCVTMVTKILTSYFSVVKTETDFDDKLGKSLHLTLYDL